MEISRQRWPAYALLLLTGALALASIVLGLLNGAPVETSDWGTGNLVYALVLSMLVYPTMGVLIALRRLGNSIGWICLGIGVAHGITGFASEYGRYALITSPGSLPGGLIAAWTDNWSYITFVVPLGVFLPLLFPDGHLPSRRWRGVAYSGARPPSRASHSMPSTRHWLIFRESIIHSARGSSGSNPCSSCCR